MLTTSIFTALVTALPAQAQETQLSIAAIRLGVTDLQTSIDFFSQHLGCEKAGDFSAEGYAMLQNGETTLVLTPVEHTVSIGNQHCHARINFAVKNLNETVANMKAAGVRFLGEKTSAVGRYATFLDPSGNQHNIKQLNQSDDEVTSPRVYDVGISVSDMAKATEFYVNTLGFEELTRKYYPPVVPVKQRGCTFFILSEDAKYNAPYSYGEKAHCGLAFAVDDLDGAIQRLRDKNVRFLHDQPQSAGNVRYIAFADPFGNVHELITHTDSQPGDQPLAASRRHQATDLAWLAGTWKLETDTSNLEEIWTAPQNGALLGTFRWHRDGKPWMYELMTIQEEKGTLVFRLRHFDAALTPWEKDGPLTYHFAQAGENEIVFESAALPDSSESGHSHPKRFVYRLIKAAGELDKLAVRLEPADANQKVHEFVFTRAQRE